MTILLIGLVVGAGVVMLGPGKRPFRLAALAVTVTSVIILTSLAWHRAELDRFRLSLLGFRYAIADTTGAPSLDRLELGGPRSSVDLYVPGTGRQLAGVIRVEGADSIERVIATAQEDGGGVLLVQEPRASWQLVGSAEFGPSDTVVVSQAPGEIRMTARASTTAGRTVVHDIEVRSPGGTVSVPLPLMARTRFFGRGRSMFRRTYPLTDILGLANGDAEPTWGQLGSFFYYDDNQLHFIDLDSEVAVASGAGGWSPAVVTVWDGERTNVRLRPAALPLTDYPELDLTLPERYGIRSLRSYGVTRIGRWLDFYLESPEAYALTREQLQDLNDNGGDRDRPEIYRVRLTASSQTIRRQAVTFRLPSDGFAISSTAVLELPRQAGRRDIGVMTPAGFAQERIGRPFPVGEEAGRSLIFRVDRHATTAGFWAGLLSLLFLAGAPFLVAALLVDTSIGTRHSALHRAAALSLATFGLVAARLFPSISAFANPPFSDESYELALWLLPVVPWLVIVACLATYTVRSERRLPGGGEMLALIGVGLVGVSFVLFSGGRAYILAAIPAVVSIFWVLVVNEPIRTWTLGRPSWIRDRIRAGKTALSRIKSADPPPSEGTAVAIEGSAGVDVDVKPGPTFWSRVWTRGVVPGFENMTRAPWVGLRLGLCLFGLRFLLWAFGLREMLPVLGQRMAVSILFTPLVGLAIALVMLRHGRALRAAVAAVEWRRQFARMLLDLGAFVFFAIGSTALLIGDFGIVLTALPGILAFLLLLLLMALRRGLSTANRVQRTGAVMRIVLPVAMFIGLQADPSSFPGYPATAIDEDLRVQQWERNELLLLERGDPDALRLIGQRRSEALGVMRETLQAYTRGNWAGSGFLQGRVSEEIRGTATQEHMASALLASEWGLLGSLGLLALLLTLGVSLIGDERDARWPRNPRSLVIPAVVVVAVPVFLWFAPAPLAQVIVVAVAVLAACWLVWRGLWPTKPQPGTEAMEAKTCWPDVSPAWLIAASCLLLFAFAGIYMLLANYGLVLFTGKNIYLFGLDSVSDALESIALLVTAGIALAFDDHRSVAVARRGGRSSTPDAAAA